ncbi:MAG: hypothetical protein ACR2GS_04580 [Thermomicrobiales bacterium]
MDYHDTLLDMILDYANLSSATKEVDGRIYRTRAMQERSGITYWRLPMKALALAMMMLLSPGLITAHDDEIALDPLTIDGAEVNRIVLDPVSRAVGYVVVEDRLFQADDSGAWTESGALADGETVIQDSADPDVLWSGTEPECYRGGGGSTPLMRSSDAGAAWTDTGAADVAPLASWADTGIVLAYGCPGLHLSLDNGATFRTLDELSLGIQVTSFAVEAAPDAAGAGPVVLVGLTGEGGTTYLHRVDLTNPAKPLVSDELLMWYAISPIGVDGDGVIYVAASHGVLVSEDEGATWDVSREGLESTTLAADPLVEFPADLEPNSFGFGALLVNEDPVIVAGVDGLYEMQSDDDRWALLSTTDAEITSLALSPAGSTLLCQTEDGVFEIALDS